MGPHLSGDEGRPQCHQGPEGNAPAHEILPIVPVPQVAKHRCQHHVTGDEHWAGEAESHGPAPVPLRTPPPQLREGKGGRNNSQP